MIKSFASRQFLVFLLTGGFAAAVNFGSRILYNRAMPFSSVVPTDVIEPCTPRPTR